MDRISITKSTFVNRAEFKIIIIRLLIKLRAIMELNKFLLDRIVNIENLI
jgi:hypothetical protein